MIHIELASTKNDVLEAFEIEKNSYPKEAAATLEAFLFRQMNFGNYFFVVKNNGIVVGVTNGVRLQSFDLADEGIKQISDFHGEGSIFCILTVAVAAVHQGKGYGFALIGKIIEQAKSDQLEGIALMCEKPLIPFYERAGFIYIKPSDSEHGNIEWHEMMLKL